MSWKTHKGTQVRLVDVVEDQDLLTRAKPGGLHHAHQLVQSPESRRRGVEKRQ